jgi:hypothetical protein
MIVSRIDKFILRQALPVWALPELTMKNTNDNVAQISAEVCKELTNR